MKRIVSVLCSIVLVLSLCFIPKSYVGAANDDSLSYSRIKGKEQLQNLIDADLQPSCIDSIPYGNSEVVGPVHKIVVPESGWIVIRTYSSNIQYPNWGKVHLYSNAALTSEVSNERTGTTFCSYVQAGTYYYQVQRAYETAKEFNVTAYAAFLPSLSRFWVSSIKYNDENTKATVTFGFNTDYTTDIATGYYKLFYIEGYVGYRYLESSTWRYDSHGLRTATLNLYSNGQYSAKLSGLSDDLSVDLHFDITNIGKKPTAYNIQYKLNGGKNNKKNIAKYTVLNKTIKLYSPTKKGYTFKGWYADKSLKKKVTSLAGKTKKNLTLYAKWEKVSVSKAKIKSIAKSGKKAFKLKIQSVSGAKGYVIQYANNSKFKKSKNVTVTSTSKTVKSLKKGKYYVKVRAYKVDSTGKKIYGKYSSTKSISVK